VIVLRVARHAPVTVKGICYGQSDVETELSADDAARALGAVSASCVWSSPSRRCAEIAARLGATHRVDARLLELSFGDWEGRAWSSLEGDALFDAWMRDWKSVAPPGGESVPQLESRVRAWLAELAGEHALVAHAGVVRALRVILRGQSWDEAMRVEVPHLAWDTFFL
jgi:alpha-ribazole phosphatase